MSISLMISFNSRIEDRERKSQAIKREFQFAISLVDVRKGPSQNVILHVCYRSADKRVGYTKLW